MPESISGLKFNDLNANGNFDAGESPLSNWQIFLDLNNNSILDSGEPSTFTNAQGNFFFSNPPIGTYAIREVQQTGFRQTTVTPFVTINTNTNLSGIVIGNTTSQLPGGLRGGTISGTKFNDLNNNGRFDSGEPALSNFQIYVDLNNNGQLDSGEPSTRTDSNGNWSFSELPAGTYNLKEVQQSGFVQTTANPSITLTAGQNVNGVLFGNTVPIVTGSISGLKFNDLNNNGRFDSGEPSLSNFQIYLDLNNNGQLDSGEPSTRTDSNGNFTFANLSPGTYNLKEVQQSGFVQTTANPSITLTAGQNVNGVLFGNTVPIATGSIAGMKFNDLNANGILDTGEPPLPNFQIFIDANNNGKLDSGEASTFTNAQGNYFFGNVPVGTYPLLEVQQSGYRQTTPSPTVTVTANSNLNGINFGNTTQISPVSPGLRSATITGTTFNDLNGNGSADPGEPALANAQIFIDINNNGRLDSGEAATVSDAQGNWSLSGLPASTYTLREVPPTGFVQTTLSPTVTVNPGQVLSNIVFGNTQAGNTRTSSAIDPLLGTSDSNSTASSSSADSLLGSDQKSQSSLAVGDENLIATGVPTQSDQNLVQPDSFLLATGQGTNPFTEFQNQNALSLLSTYKEADLTTIARTSQLLGV
ncbi:MAG: MSCRAMM family protein [Actinomycetota bacterium]